MDGQYPSTTHILYGCNCLQLWWTALATMRVALVENQQAVGWKVAIDPSSADL